MKTINFEITEWNAVVKYLVTKDATGKITISQDGKKKVDFDCTTEGAQKLIEALEYIRR